MKRKLLAITLMMATTLAFTACGETAVTEDTQTEVTEEAAEGDDTAEDAEAGDAAAEIPKAELSVELVETDGSITDLSQYPLDGFYEMGEYKGMEVSVAAKVIVDEETATIFAEDVFKNMAASYGLEQTEGVVELGDVTNIDYEGKLDGVAFEGGTATGQTLEIGSGQFIDGFEDGLIGVAIGDTVDLTLTFPEDYSSTDLAGQEVVFTVTVNSVVPDMSDELIAEIATIGEEETGEAAPYGNVAEFMTFVTEYLQSEEDATYDMALESAILTKLEEIAVVNKVPDFIYDMQFNSISTSVTEGLAAEASMYGMEVEDYAIAVLGDSLENYILLSSEAYSKQLVSLQAIANAEGLNATEEQVNTFVSDYMAFQGLSTEDELYAMVPREEIILYLMSDNVLQFLIENAVVLDV